MLYWKSVSTHINNYHNVLLINNLKNYIFVSFPRITITTKGKNSAIEAKAIPDLVKLLDDPESEVRLNALKVS